MVFTASNSLPSREELNPIANEVINELPDEQPDDTTEQTTEQQINDLLSLESKIDSSQPYIYKAVTIKVLDQVFTLGDERLQALKIDLGANEKTSTVNVTVLDPDLKIADAFFTFSRANGGIKLPVEFGSQSTTTTDPGTSGDSGSPTGSVNLDDIPNGLKGDELAKVIVQYCKDTSKGNVTDAFHIAAILGTCEIESSMGEFLSEIGGESASYAPWYGRGLVQVTHQENYQKVGRELGLGESFFTDNPDALTELKYAVPALVVGMRDGWYTGTKLSDCSTFDETRDIVNPGEGGSRRQTYIGYCEAWQTRLDAGEFNYANAQYQYPPNDGSQSLQIPNVNAPFDSNQPINQIDNSYPPISSRPSEPGENPTLSPNPSEAETEGLEGTTTQPEAVNVTTEVGNPIEVILETVNNKVFTFKFILFDDSVNSLPSAIFSFSGKAIRYQLNVEDKTENFEDVTPQEYLRILVTRYNLQLVDNTTTTQRERIDLIDQRNQTDHEVALSIATENDLNIIDNTADNTIEIEDKNTPKTPKKIIVTDIIDLRFSDQGVTTEEPLYPVTLIAFTTDELLELKPEDSITLDNVYSFVPDSLKKDNWLVNTISHDVMTEITTIDLTKYIPKPVTSGGIAVGGGQLSEAQILEKYKSAVVKVGSASGCFISADGYILTAAHMSGSTDIKTLDGQSYNAQEIDIVESSDIMLMKVDASNVPFAPIAPDTSIYTSGSRVAITKIGHGITSEDGAGEGGNTPKDWDATTSFVREIAQNGYRGLTGKVVVADDKEIDFVNPGDSGCPWFDPYGLIVTCTSGGDRTHEEGAGKKDSAWGGDVSAIITMLDKNGVKYTKGTRQAATTGNNGGGGTNTGGDGVYPGWTLPSKGVLTSDFGLRDAPTSGASSNHKGWDISGGCGADIYAASNGVVVDLDNDTNGSGYGNYIVIKHDDPSDVWTLYGHCTTLLVANGDRVTMGQKIATEGTTGTSTGCHLHFGVAKGASGDNIWSGTFVNPVDYLPKPSNAYSLTDISNFAKCLVILPGRIS